MIIDHLPWRAQLELLSFYEQPMASPASNPTTSVKVGEEIATFTLLKDARVSGGEEQTAKWAARVTHPWIAVQPHKGQTVIRLTSEGKRRLYVLRSMAEASGARFPRSDA